MHVLSELSYRLEPHGRIEHAVVQGPLPPVQCGVGGVYPGWWDEGGVGGVLYRYPGPGHPRVHIPVYLALRAYPRPNEGLFDDFMRFLR